MSPIAFEFSKPFPLHSCKLHALLSAAYILFACLLELCDDCLTCPKVAKICQELKLGKGIAFIWSSSLITPPPSRHTSDPTECPSVPHFQGYKWYCSQSCIAGF